MFFLKCLLSSYYVQAPSFSPHRNMEAKAPRINNLLATRLKEADSGVERRGVWGQPGSGGPGRGLVGATQVPLQEVRGEQG